MESLKTEVAEMVTNMSSSFRHSISSLRMSFSHEELSNNEDETELQWAAMERMAAYDVARTLPVTDYDQKGVNGDFKRLGAQERRVFIESLIQNIEKDNRRLLQKVKERMDKVDVSLPTVEVRYENLSVQAKCEVVHGKPLPTLWNVTKSMFKGLTRILGMKSEEATIDIIKDASGIIKPSRMTLLLGPPGCGKTTFLLALAGKLSQALKVTGNISYNGFKLEEFVPEKTSAYISQYDLHTPQMTVRETIDFSARCQGVGSREDIMSEVARREKLGGIVPEPEVDTYMKEVSLTGSKRTLQTDYSLKILGMDSCSDTLVGDAMKRGISGGQKKRLTTGEIIVGPTRALFMDEISNGLDSSTTFQIVSCLQQLVHITEITAVVSLLQPAPEIFDLFDDIILMAKGKVIYHGPRSLVLDFFESCGFKCPERKGIADFLQEVISRKDQAQYWYHTSVPYNYITADHFAKRFGQNHLGKKLDEELSKPSNRSQLHKNALSFNIYSHTKWELLKICMAREFLLMKRDSFVYVFKTTQLAIVGLITMTVFLRTQMDVDSIHANDYMGAIFYTLIRLTTNGIAELASTVHRLPVFYRQRDLNFYPAWAYAIPACILKIPISLIDSFLWTALTYYVIGYSPEAGRFFCQFFLLFALHQMASSLFRVLGSICRTPIVASYVGNSALVTFCLFCGFILPRTSMPAWLEWAFWISPITYAEIGMALNEFKAPRWQKISLGNMTLGQQVLEKHGLDFEGYFVWVSLGALFGFTLIFNLGFTLALSYLNSPGTSRSIISHHQISLLQEGENSSHKQLNNMLTVNSSTTAVENTGVVLPFKPLTVAFQDVQYYVDTPQVMKEQGCTQKQLQLLCDITGAFRPGILTALMGVSGAGKTTLMDVLSGRKTGGFIEGSIKIGGYPKIQRTFARISGYCEQSDIHSPNLTVKESITFSAWLRLSPEIDPSIRNEFVEEVIETIELDDIKDALVGSPGVNGLSTEQRKRLTIAVELVANPSIIFMDEPTSGLDARAAAIVMRAVKNIVDTGRTVVCTIHQPSINIFESFDELLLMKRGGQIIYSGSLGQHSSKLIEYFEAIPGVPKIKENHNPATWMLDISTTSAEQQLGVDFAQIYKKSTLYQENKARIEQLGKPSTGSTDLQFLTRFPQNRWGQYKACLWKQHYSYWRSPTYNLARFTYMVVLSVTFGAAFWQQGKKIENEQDVFNVVGSLFLPLIFFGLSKCTTILPVVATERIVLYREKFAGMYSSWAYSFAQVTVEIPYVFIEALTFVAIIYPAIGYYWSAYKFMWIFYTIFCSLLCAVYLGMLIMSVSPNGEVAGVLAAASYTLLNLFAGYLLPKPKIPKWWVWLYWVCPTSWALNGLFASQYGDITEEISAYGEMKPLNDFLRDHYGFRDDRLGLVAVMIAFFPIAFAILFAYFIGKLNFQRR